MKKQMFESYPRMQQVVEELHLEPYIDEMEWHYFENADEALKAVYLTYNDLISDSIPARLAAKERINNEYLEIGNQLHVFAREQGRYELNMSNEDVTRLFQQVEIGGSRFK